MDDNLSVGLDVADDEDAASEVPYAERVQNGIAWLITEGPGQGHLLHNLCVHLEELNVNMPEACVLGWSSGKESAMERAQAYHAAIRDRGIDRRDGYAWASERGFRLGDGEPHSWSDYYDLTDEWKTALRQLCEEDHR